MVVAMKKLFAVIAWLLFGGAAALTLSIPIAAQNPVTAWTASIKDVRSVAATIPGARPLRINVLKFAESHRTKNFQSKAPLPSPACRRARCSRSSTATGT